MPTNIVIFNPLKKESNVNHFNSSRPSTSSDASASKVKHESTPSFSKILTAQCIESCAETSAPKNYSNVKKGFNMSAIFSSSRKMS